MPSTTSPYIWIEPPVRVVGEALVAGLPREALGRGVAQAEVEDRVHHPRHRDRGARAHREEQRVAPDRRRRLPVALLEASDVLGDLVLEPGRHSLALAHVRAARVGRDREARRDRNADLRHLREARRPCRRAARVPAVERVVEVVDVLGAIRRESSHRLQARRPRSVIYRERACANSRTMRMPSQIGVNTHVEQDERGSEQRPPQRPPPERNRRLLAHDAGARRGLAPLDEPQDALRGLLDRQLRHVDDRTAELPVDAPPACSSSS